MPAPPVGDEVGTRAVTTGIGASHVKVWLQLVSAGAQGAEIPPTELTTTKPVPAVCAGSITVITPSLGVPDKLASIPSKVTWKLEGSTERWLNPLPTTATSKPPVDGPFVGLTPVTVGGA